MPFQLHNILLAIPESSLKVDAVKAKNVVSYKKALLLKPIMEGLEGIRCKG